MLGLAIAGPQVRAEPSVFWGKLTPGPYAVGFEAVEKYDYSRTYRDKYDYDGVPYEGERTRPVQICVWYPAEPAEESTPFGFAEYVFPLPEDGEFYDILGEFQNRVLANLFVALGNRGSLIQDVMNQPASAVGGAPRVSGSFPLIVYHGHSRTGVCEHAVLFEYLASHGYIVAASHTMGEMVPTPEATPADMEATTRDREFVRAFMRDYPNVDPDRIGLIGRGYGGMSALLMQMRDSDVDAVVAIDPLFTYPPLFDFVAQNPFFMRERMQCPLMVVYPQGVEGPDMAWVDSLVYSDRYVVGIPVSGPNDLSVYGCIAAFALDTTGAAGKDGFPVYENLCRRTLAFCETHLKGDSAALDAAVAASPGDVVADVKPGMAAPPSEVQFRRLIEQGRIDKAAEIFDELRKATPDLVIFREAAMNAMGYQLLQQNRLADAAKAFKMNTDAYPNSANVWDSYADICQAQGDTETAITCYEKVLEVLPADSTANPQLKEILEANATAGLERLKQ